ncbi:hypothetical protein ACLB1N_01165 [Escherichia coli]
MKIDCGDFYGNEQVRIFNTASSHVCVFPPSVPAFSLPASRMTDRANKCVLPEP